MASEVVTLYGYRDPLIGGMDGRTWWFADKADAEREAMRSYHYHNECVLDGTIAGPCKQAYIFIADTQPNTWTAKELELYSNAGVLPKDSHISEEKLLP